MENWWCHWLAGCLWLGDQNLFGSRLVGREACLQKNWLEQQTHNLTEFHSFFHQFQIFLEVQHGSTLASCLNRHHGTGFCKLCWSNWWIVSPCGWVPIRWEVGKIWEGKARMFTTCLNWFVGEIGVDYFSPMNPSMRPWSWSSMFQGNLDLASGAQMASIILAPLYRLHDPFGKPVSIKL